MSRGKKGKTSIEKGKTATASAGKEEVTRALDEALPVVCGRQRDGAPIDINDLTCLAPYIRECGPLFSKRLEKASDEEFKALLSIALKLELRSAAESLKKTAISKELPMVLRKEALEAAETLGADGLAPLFEQIGAAEATKIKIETALGGALEEKVISPSDLAAEMKNCAPSLRQELIGRVLARAPSEYVAQICGADEEIGLEVARLIGAAKGSNPAELLQVLLSKIGSKKIQKELKKARFRLRSKGIEIPEVVVQSQEQVAAGLPLSKDEGYLTGYDDYGDRIIMLGLRRPLEGIYYIWGLVNDFEGLKEFAFNEISRKDYRGLIEKLRAGSSIPLVESDAAYCVHLLKEAYSICVERGGEPPAGYFEASSILARAGRDFQKPLIYELIDVGEVAGDATLLRQAPDLLNDRNRSSWTLRGDTIEKYAHKFEEAESSPIILSDYQKMERLDAIIGESMREFFSPLNVRLMRRKLEEIAYICYLQGAVKTAKVSLSAALYFDRADFQPASHPLLEEIMEESLSQAASEADRERRIILPGSTMGLASREAANPEWLKGR